MICITDQEQGETLIEAKLTRHLVIEPEDNERLACLCGPYNQNLLLLERSLGVEINNRGCEFDIIGIPASVAITQDALKSLYEKTSETDLLTNKDIQLLLKSLECEQTSNETNVKEKLSKATIKLRQTQISPKTLNQQHYLESIKNYDINFGVGPAGTGKTFLAAACAVDALEQEKVSRIILTRPAVEAGESLGFLPGDLTQKVDPYLRPLYDALFELMGGDRVAQLTEKQQIEIAPLAFMRGRTLNDAFVILDEAQNTTKEQMKMLLTRIGYGSKVVITGDITQVDLPKRVDSGLRHALMLLQSINAVRFTFFTSQDAVRHPLVQKIIEAYESADD